MSKKARSHKAFAGSVPPNILSQTNILPPKMHSPPQTLNPVQKSSRNHVSAVQYSQVRKRCRNASIIGVSSLVNQSSFDYYRTHHLNSFNETNSSWYAPVVCMDWIWDFLDSDSCSLQQDQEWGFLCCSWSRNGFGFCIFWTNGVGCLLD